jgi:hypothetical protein
MLTRKEEKLLKILGYDPKDETEPTYSQVDDLVMDLEEKIKILKSILNKVLGV